MEKINPLVYRVWLPTNYPMHPYEVKDILGHRYTNKRLGSRLQYLVQWKGYGPADNMYIAEDALRNSPYLKRRYWAAQEERQ
ncbi:uncharacterized protein SCHCODRAFT_02469874, partial [Schizophyllum commune H4-8]|uniref:uncharacterized protein n=1 Tax=Schizophyllum commune (strain H4-8 / FGSC 9210) TaxID=578458 RepID=UPI002160DDE1